MVWLRRNGRQRRAANGWLGGLGAFGFHFTIAKACDDIGSAAGRDFNINQGAIVCVFQDIIEAAITVVGFIKLRFFPLHGVFNERCIENFMIFAHECIAGFNQEPERFPLAFRQVFFNCRR